MQYKAVPRHSKFFNEWRGANLYALGPPSQSARNHPRRFEEHCKTAGTAPLLCRLIFTVPFLYLFPAFIWEFCIDGIYFSRFSDHLFSNEIYEAEKRCGCFSVIFQI